MLIKKDGDNIKTGVIVRGDFEPVSVGNISTYKTKEAISNETEFEVENTYNTKFEALKVFGKSEQKAKWHQAEGKTTQIQETGYNLLDCEDEWTATIIPINSGDISVTNIQTGKGCVSFTAEGTIADYVTVTKQTPIHLKAGQYYVTYNSNMGIDNISWGSGDQFIVDGEHVITIPEDGDYTFSICLADCMGDVTVDNLMIAEGDTSKTYQEYGYSKPSPAYPSELTSHIPAGSYQIPTENGIYEVTLTEDLRGLDDTYRDFIRFDSVSGTGYLEQNTLLVRMTRANLAPYRNTSDVTYRFSGTSAFAKYLPKTNASASILCNRLKRYHLTSELLANDIVGVSNYTESGMAYNNVYIFLSKSDIGITADDTADTMQEKAYTYLDENPLYILVGGYSYREELTFTKVESSTLPVLPWTAYGINLFDGVFESGFYTSEGDAVATNYIRSANYIPVQPNTQYHFLNNKEDDTFLWYDGGKNFISEVSDLSSPSPANARYMRFFFYGTDLSTEYMICSGAKPTAFEPFNPTPPESLTPTPDYPQQIYDLKDVTVTSRGKNLFSGGNITLNQYANNVTEYVDMTCLKAGKTYTWRCDYEVVSGTENDNIGNLLLYNSSQTKWVRFSIGTAKQIPVDWDFTENTFVLYGTGGNGQRITNITKSMFVEGDTIPFVDKYRCTSAEIPLSLGAISDDKDYLICDGNAVKKYQHIRQFELSDVNYCRINNVGSISDPYCHYFVYYNNVLESCKIGTTGIASHGFSVTVLGENYGFRAYLHVPWSVLGFTSAPTATEANEAMKNYRIAQSKLGTPIIIQYVLNIPVETEITDAWAQDLIGLKTAPYYTKLFADKETGGISVIYKCFEDYKDLFPSPSVLIQKSLIGSDGKNIVTSDGNSVIAQ